ncbi:hypothetical protein ACH4S8_11475 [Streptomyces sp. NPDC021080]|uniref:hypothetical protein n=1 Tax=Streptomyces sp. NPDC021080 TaxID=3365110 RepID=UPI0037A272EB
MPDGPVPSIGANAWSAFAVAAAGRAGTPRTGAMRASPGPAVPAAATGWPPRVPRTTWRTDRRGPPSRPASS